MRLPSHNCFTLFARWLLGGALIVVLGETLIRGADDESLAPPVPDVGHQVANELATQVLNELSALWSVRRSEIVTADVSYLMTRGTPEQSSAVSPEAARRLIAEHDFGSDARQLPKLGEVLLGRALVRYPDGIPSRLITDGSSTRYDFGDFRQLRHGDIETMYDGDNRQVDVFPRGQSNRLFASLDDFRWVPAASVPLDRYLVEAVDADVIRVTSRGGDVRNWFDRRTGFPLRIQNFYPETRTLFQESWFGGLTEFSGGVPCPTTQVELSYRDGRLCDFWLRRIDSAEFNGDLPADAFQMPAPELSKVFDHRGIGGVPVRTRTAMSDVTTVLSAPRYAAERPVVPGDTGSRLRWLLAINGLLLTLAGVYLWRRDRRIHAAAAEALKNQADSRSRSPHQEK